MSRRGPVHAALPAPSSGPDHPAILLGILRQTQVSRRSDYVTVYSPAMFPALSLTCSPGPHPFQELVLALLALLTLSVTDKK